ncbi:C80 family cysteine peptidase [Candidatus Williamhamiltonella defendens]|uniref:C80 family cysteine peptidase n=1 Tax=Candidatus Williamhamiltonella defendens TaxID=138072 RepID=UPI00158283D6|nr:C80 family cysteine peptidase [Candidatus Hamiltonella defensa]
MTQEQSPSFLISELRSDAHTHRIKRTPTGFVPVDQWEVQSVITRSDGGSTRYVGQVIIQLENNPTVLNAALRLAGKHPGSVLVQLDQQNHYRVLSGSPKTLQGKLRWQVVGHGSEVYADGKLDAIRAISGIKPDDLATLLIKFNQHFSKKYTIDSTPNRISLVGCRLIDHNGKNFATQFAHAMKSRGIQADISARKGLVSVPHDGFGKKFTRETQLVNRAQTAGDTLLLGWDKTGALIYKKHSSAFRLLSPVLDAWAPRHFTDPKIQNKQFKYLIYPSSIRDLMDRKGVFSKNIKEKLSQSDFISASILSNQTLGDHKVGVILEVPEQNILAAAPHESIFKPNLESMFQSSGARIRFIKKKGLQKTNQMINAIEDRLSHTKNRSLSALVRHGLLSNQLFSYPQRVSTPDDIIHQTLTRNTVLVTGRPDVNIYPHYPVTKNIKITGLFFIDSDDPKNKEGSRSFTLLREAAREMTQELDIELKIIKIRREADSDKSAQSNITPKINQNRPIDLVEMTPDQKNISFSGSFLTEKLQRIWILINGIASNNHISFGPHDLKLLTEFFHLPSRRLDWKRLNQTVSHPLFYSQFIGQIQCLMELSDTHGQFRGLTGQTALKRLSEWQNFVFDNMMHWNSLIKIYTPRIASHPAIYPVMQGIYMGDGSDVAQQKAQKVSLAYLSMLRLGDKDLRVKLLKAFETHAEIHAKKIFFDSTDQDINTFGRLIHELEERGAFIKKGLQKPAEFFNTLANETAGYYQLRMGEHILTIAKRQGTDQKTHWYLYDANFGEIVFTDDHAQNTSHILKSMLNDYFACLRSFSARNGAFLLDVYQLNFAQILTSPSVKKLKQFISKEYRESLFLSTLKPVKTQTNKNSLEFSKLFRTVGMLGQVNKGISWIRSLTLLSHYWSRRSSEQLNHSQKHVLELEAQLAIASIVYDVGSVCLELSSKKLGHHLIEKFSSQSFRVLASRMQRFQYAAGMNLVRYGGACLNMLGAAFDIYQAHKAGTELKTVTDPDVRQDLQVSLAVSSLSASITIASGLALLALAGKMALVSGAVGIALGVLTAVVGGMYLSVRQIQQIERYTNLTGLQKLRTGWLSFWGADIDVEVTNQVTKGQAKEQAKKNVHDQFKKNFQALLDSDKQIEAVYYSMGEIMLSEHPYQKLTGKKWTMLSSPSIPLNQYLFIDSIKDKILPSQAQTILSDYQTQKLGHRAVYADLRLEDSEYKFYDIEGLLPTDDQISLDTDAHSESILSLKRPVEPSSSSSLSASVVKSDTSDFKNLAKIYFFLGAGNDGVTGHPEKSNVFDIGDGVKNFKGGHQSDTFIFNGTKALSQPSVFDGVKGTDALIANKKPSQGGYYVNLQENAFYFTHEHQKIAVLKNIDHIETCAETDDVILGNAQSNILNGKGGKDKLMGFDGNDILVAQAGKLDGGKGTDSYRVLQNTDGEAALLIIEEDDDPDTLSHVFLDYSVTQIISIKRIKQHLFIELNNDNQSITTLTLFHLYSAFEPKKRRLTSQYIFYTKDGVIFSGLPAEIAFDPNKDEPETLILMATYAPNFDQKLSLPKTDSLKKPFIIQKMSGQKQTGMIDISGEKKILPDFLRLVAQETGFDDDLQGNELSNILHSKTGEDILEGKGGRDVYIIEDRPTEEVRIHNYDAPKTGSPEQDIILLPFLLKDIRITQDDDDVILSHFYAPAEHVNLRLMNFMIEESYRHLSIIDKGGRVHTVSVNAKHEPDFVQDHLFPHMSTKNGDHILSQLRQITPEFSEAEQVFHVDREHILQTVIPVMSF